MMLCHPDYRHEEARRMADKERLLPYVMHPGVKQYSKKRRACRLKVIFIEIWSLVKRTGAFGDWQYPVIKQTH
jgi:hypothetical protein